MFLQESFSDRYTLKNVRMYFMDNLASSMHCGFSRNFNSVLNKSSEEVSVELHPAVQKVWPNTNFLFPSLNQLKLQGWKRAAVFVQGIESVESIAGIQSPAFWL